MEVEVPPGTRAKFIQVTVKPSHIRAVVLDKVVFEVGVILFLNYSL